MRNTSLITTFIIICLSFHCTSAYCSVQLIKSGMMKDGGTHCVEYDRDGTNIKCCIDGRELSGTFHVFIGGYPGAENSRVIARDEMKSFYNDISEITESEECNKYINMTHDEIMTLTRNAYNDPDKQKMRSRRIAYYCRALPSFKRDLFIRLLLSNWYLWICTFMIVSFFLYRRSKARRVKTKDE